MFAFSSCHKDLIFPDDGAGNSRTGQGCFPGDVFRGGPGEGWRGPVGDSIALRTAPLRPSFGAMCLAEGTADYQVNGNQQQAEFSRRLLFNGHWYSVSNVRKTSFTITLFFVSLLRLFPQRLVLMSGVQHLGRLRHRSEFERTSC